MRCPLLIALLTAFALAACRGPAGAGAAADLDERLEVTFEGRESFSAQELRAVVARELEELGERAIDKAAVDDAAFALELFYRRKGHADALVTYEYEDGAPVRAKFRIDEGPRVLVERFVVAGELLGESELERITRDAGAGKPYVRDRARSVVRALRDAHLTRGYLSTRVTGPEIEVLDTGNVSLSATVEPGPLYTLHTIEFEGALDELEAALRRIADGYVGSAYTPHVAFRIRSAFIQRHVALGYPDCSASVDAEQGEDGAVRLSLTVRPGELVHVAAVRVEGNVDLDPERIRSRIELAPGDRYDPKKLDDSFRFLYGTGLFDAVRLYLAEDSGSERTLVAEVVESPTLELFLEPGWGSYEGPRVRAGIDERNVFGGGRRARLEGHFSPLDHGVELLVADPWLFRSAVTGQANLFFNKREEPSFTHREIGAGVSVRKEWTRRLSTTFGYELSLSDLSQIEVGGAIPPELLDDVNIGSLVFSLTRNTRDNVLMPTRGSTMRFYTSFAAEPLGSEVELFDLGLDATRVLALGDDTVLAGSARVSGITPFSATDVVPLPRRKFNGGENTVRSFRESELGPVDPSGEPIGGETMTVFSLELRRKLAGNVSGALFYDTGNVALQYEDFFDFEDYRHGIGVGVRYLLPIGPLRFDYAINPDARGREDEWVFHFAVGLPF